MMESSLCNHNSGNPQTKPITLSSFAYSKSSMQESHAVIVKEVKIATFSTAGQLNVFPL